MIRELRFRRRVFAGAMLLVSAAAATLLLQGQAAPSTMPALVYEKSKSSDPIALLQQQVDAGKVTLAFDRKHGYLPAVLKALGIPASSQSLVFSKTSFQRESIAPWQPRALYFNMDTYIGWVQSNQMLEIAAVDKDLGTIFYTLDQRAVDKPRFQRQGTDCLQCHDGSMTGGVPGLMIRSTFTEASGSPMLSIPNYLTTSASPFEERWGGWYITGKTGTMKHMGNLVIHAGETPKGANLLRHADLTDLSARFDTSRYLAPGSDLVGVLVFTHQAQVHNLLTKVAYEMRGIQHLGISSRKGGVLPAETPQRIAELCDPLVKEMLFRNDLPLPNAVEGSSDFARAFVAAGVKDKKGRSLRDLDLQTRVFKYPVSYLIYSESFEALPASAKAYIYRQIFDALTGKNDDSQKAEERTAILEILRETVKDLPGYWK